MKPDKKRERLKLFRVVMLCSAGFFLCGDPLLGTIAVISAAAHEAGHVAALCCFCGVKGIAPSGCGMKLEPGGSFSYRGEIICAFAGPFVNIALFLFSLAYMRAFRTGAAVMLFAAVNMGLAAYNLLPIRGYDGYRILRAFLEMREVKAAGEVCAAASIVCLAAALFFSAYILLRTGNGFFLFGAMLFQIVMFLAKDAGV